ncbi:MAG: DMT family transporter [Desulfobacterales bacterium]
MKSIENHAETHSNASSNQEPTFLASLVIIALCTSFGVNAVAIKISLTGMGTFTTAGLRFLIASLAITIWALFTGQPIGVNRNQLRKLVLLAIIFTCQLGLFYLGLSLTYASRGVLMTNLQPFFVLILAHFFIPGDRITGRKIVGILLGFSGVFLLFLEKKGISADVRTGDLLVLVTVLLWAVNAIYTKKIISNFRPFQIVLYPGMISVPFFLMAGYIWDDPMIGEPDLKVVLSLLYQSLVTASFGFVVWTSMLRKYGAVTLHSYIFILPVSGVFFGGVILGEPVGTFKVLLALLLIVSGIIIVHSSFPFGRLKIEP